MNSGVQKVFLVDDDDSVRRALARLLRASGFEAMTFGSPQAFLDGYAPEARGCLVLDIAMPGFNGLELQQALARRGAELPIIFLTGQADVPMTVQALKRGAVDFLTKTVDPDALLAAVRQAFEQDRIRWQARTELADIQRRLVKLTPREHEVMLHVVTGELNKQIAAALNVAEDTIKIHRGRVMAKLEVQSVAELVRLVERCGLGRSDAGPGPAKVD